MTTRRSLISLAPALLLAALASPGARPVGQSVQSARADRAGARDLQGALRHQQGRVRGPGDPRRGRRNGADRFYNLVKNGFYDNVRFFRVISGFMVQFGISGDPKLSAQWREARIQDDPVKQSNKRGFITYAMAGPNTRTSQVFINFGDNASLDGQGFSPFGQVVSGMNIVDALNAEYGEGAPRGRGPDQGRLQMEGNDYLAKEFSRMDFIRKATIEK